MVPARKPSSKAKIKTFVLANVGKIVSSLELRDAVGPEVSEWARRVRELRDEAGWSIITHNDSANLKPGEYMLSALPPERPDINFGRKLSAKVTAVVLDRNGFTCQMCGLSPGDTDPYSNRKVRLHIGHIKDKSLGGKDELSNLRALCSTCNQGAKNVKSERPSTIGLLAQIRRAGIDEQRAVYAWLTKKFGS